MMENKKLSPRNTSQGILVDSGFDLEFSDDRIDAFCELFTSEKDLLDYVTHNHNEDHAFDLKRGEFYPELLRAISGLKNTVSKVYGVDPVQVHPNYGSNGSIDTIFTATKIEEIKKIQRYSDSVHNWKSKIQQGGGALFTSPTYFRNYNSAQARGLDIHLVPLTDDFHFDSEAFIRAIEQHKPSIVVLVSPNNPTGIPIADTDILEVLECLPEGMWAMIDRTLVNIADEISTKELLHRYKENNLVVLHSFSKYHGMSHLRIGVSLFSNPELAHVIQPYLPLGIGFEGCLKANKIVRTDGGIVPNNDIVGRIRENRRILFELVQSDQRYGITPFTGNYGLLKLHSDLNADQITEYLKQSGLYVMSGSDFPEPDSSLVRLHTGGPIKYIRELCSALNSF